MLQSPLRVTRTHFLLVFVLIYFGTSLSAQRVEQANALSVRSVFPNYHFQFDPSISASDFSIGGQIAYGRHLNQLMNLELPIHIAKAGYPLDASGDIFEERLYLGMDALLQLKAGGGQRILTPILYAGIGFNVEAFEVFDLSAPVGVMLDIKLGERLYLSPKLEYRVGFTDQRNALMPALGIKILPGKGARKKDSDNDGIPDTEDLCPNQPGLTALNGCPDTDGDGIPDGEDACPKIAGPRQLNGCPDTDGDGIPDQNDQCPSEYGPASNYGCPLRDSDGDGISDDQDDCPNVPGLAALNGCPDTDGDGIPDAQDLCPRVPGPSATQGCPDTDGDLVMDSDDDCPNTPGPASNNGCPGLSDEDRATLAYAAQNIQFETSSAILLPASRSVLDLVVDILRRNPDFSVSIDGHTDSIGSAIANQQLSEDRAQACYEYLRSQGIPVSRMSYQGFGESRPIADNATREGREQNRRVEFNLQR